MFSMALELIQSRSGGRRRTQIRCFDMSIKIFREKGNQVFKLGVTIRHGVYDSN